VIGADSKEGNTYGGSPTTVEKILKADNFVILMYGASELNTDSRDKEAIKGKNSQGEAFTALRNLFDQIIRERIADHIQHKNSGKGRVYTDETFQQKTRIGFVLLSVNKAGPAISNYEVMSNGKLTGPVEITNRGKISSATSPYIPTPFSIEFLPPYTLENLKSNPYKVVMEMLKNPVDHPPGIGPPYVVDRFDGDNLTEICRVQSSDSNEVCEVPHVPSPGFK
jgi:hypothetical protein